MEQVLGGSGRGVILRTSWVMDPVGKNFALTMLRLHREKPAISVVACWCKEMALTDTPIELPAVLHWSDEGASSWYDAAVAVGELGVELGLLEQPAAVSPLTTAEYPWRQELRKLLEAVA